MQAFFISDLHLKTMEERNSQKLLRFLLHLWQLPAGSVTHLCFVGDIFDVWVSDHEIFSKRWTNIIKAIDSLLKKHHCQFFYVEGNHDLHINKFWETKFGATVLTEPFTGLFGPWIIHMAHGDLINKRDESYLQFRRRIRSPWMVMLAHKLPGWFWNSIGQWMSGHSAKKSRQISPEKQKKLLNMIRNYAVKTAQKDRCDFVVTGHFHVEDEYEFENEDKKSKSVNLGTWLDNSKTPIYLIDDQGGRFYEF